MTTFSYPKDLKPAQRAMLKFGSHIIIIAAFNAALAAISYFDSLTSGSPVNWSMLATVVVAQAVLAALDAAKKFFTAQQDMPISTMLDLARQEVAARYQAQPYTAQETTAITAINNLLMSDLGKDSAGPASTTPAPIEHTPAPAAEPVTVNTLPDISAVVVPKSPQN